MLVLSRKPDERLLIGDNIVVSVLRVRGDTVRLGIDAPPHVRVLRDELLTNDPPASDEPSEQAEPGNAQS